MTGGEEGASTKQFADYRPQLELFAAKRLRSVGLASQEWDAVEGVLTILPGERPRLLHGNLIEHDEDH